MAREIPEVVRAAAGLAAVVLDEARKLPETLPGLPVRLIGMAMQHAMKVQQHYAGLVARGDELFTGLRGENEPGLATFDDEVEPVTVTQPSNGYRESAFDRAGDSSPVDETLTDAEVEALPADPAADAVTTVVDELADQVETGQQSIEELADEAPAIGEILDEIAIDELVDEAPSLEETAPGTPTLSVVEDSPVTEDADAVGSALLESDAPVAGTLSSAEESADVSTTVDVITPDGEIAAVEASVTDEGIAAPEAPTASAPEAPAAPKPEAPAAPKPQKAAKAAKAPKGSTADKPSDTADTTGATDPAKATDTAKATDSTDATDTSTAATDTNAGPATATDESGSDVAAATGVRTDGDDAGTSAEDSAITEGADVDAVGGSSDAPTDDPQGASEASGSQAAGTAPIDGYDSFSIAQLRGRLRGYALSTVQDLLAYEDATRAREPYLRLLRNRLEKLEKQAVESSPLAPRGV